jgi:4-hydroxy 2-oxovalerate aldolase
MIKASILDCTLRDGAHVNKGLFGKDRIKNIINNLIKSNVECIEVGFLTDNADYSEGSTLFDRIEQIDQYIPVNKNSSVSLMIRPDQCDFSKLTTKFEHIDIIRFAFHDKNLELTKKYITRALELGYTVCANPVNVASYNDDDLRNILRELSKFPLDTVSIVDTFGSLTKKSFRKYCDIFEEELAPSIKLGLHLHENMSQTFGLICDYLEFGNIEREIVIDSSLMGMGRIPGNLCTEIIATHLNTAEQKYNLEFMLAAISSEILPEKAKNDWGYSPVYLLTANKNIHRSYGEYLNKLGISYDKCEVILEKIKSLEIGDAYDEVRLKEIALPFIGTTNE